MHDLALVNDMVSKTLALARTHNAKKVNKIYLDVGELVSTPEHMKESFKIISQDYDILKGTELMISVVNAVVNCKDCSYSGPLIYENSKEPTDTDMDYNHHHLHSHHIIPMCPKCKGRKIKVLQGTECILKDIEFEV